MEWLRNFHQTWVDVDQCTEIGGGSIEHLNAFVPLPRHFLDTSSGEYICDVLTIAVDRWLLVLEPSHQDVRETGGLP